MILSILKSLSLQNQRKTAFFPRARKRPLGGGGAVWRNSYFFSISGIKEEMSP